MVDSVGGFEIPITLKQLESSNNLLKNPQKDLDETPNKILESFGNILKKHIQETNLLENEAGKAQELFATGGNITIHEVMNKTSKAEMAMQLTLQLRNKLVAAYKEIQNMHV